MPTLRNVVSCGIYRPFGGTLIATVDGQIESQRGHIVPFNTATPQFTHTVKFPEGTDCQDGITRPDSTATSLTYAAGDEVRVGSSKWSVMYVDKVNRGGDEFLLAYLLRHTL
jgi:hypothetical protein